MEVAFLGKIPDISMMTRDPSRGGINPRPAKFDKYSLSRRESPDLSLIARVVEIRFLQILGRGIDRKSPNNISGKRSVGEDPRNQLDVNSTQNSDCYNNGAAAATEEFLNMNGTGLSQRDPPTSA